MLTSTCSYICVKYLYIFFTICTYIKWLYHKHCFGGILKKKNQAGKIIYKTLTKTRDIEEQEVLRFVFI